MNDSNAGILVQEGADAAQAAAADTLEQDRPNVRVIVIAVIAILTIVSVLIFGLVELFTWSLRAEIRRKQLEPISSLLRDVRAEEQAKLNRYQWIDEQAGIVRIPLTRAKQLVLSDYAAPDRKPNPLGGGAKPETGPSAAEKPARPEERSR